MPEQVAALEAVGRGRGVPGFERARLWHSDAAREAVREDLVEDGVADPVRAGGAERTAHGASALRTFLRAGAGAGPVEPRMISRVSRVLCSGRSRSGRAIIRSSSRAASSPFCADRLVDGRQRRVRMRRDVQVVEADDADVLGHAQAGFAGGPHDADGHHVAHGQDGRRPQAVLPDAAERGHAAVEGGRTHDDPLVAQLDAAQLEALAIAGQAARGDRLGGAGRVLEEVGHVGRLHPDHGELPVAE